MPSDDFNTAEVAEPAEIPESPRRQLRPAIPEPSIDVEALQETLARRRALGLSNRIHCLTPYVEHDEPLCAAPKQPPEA